MTGSPLMGRSCADWQRLLGAVNDYLSAQNFAGYKDGDYGHDEGCRDVRRRLCEVAYNLNATGVSSTEKNA